MEKQRFEIGDSVVYASNYEQALKAVERGVAIRSKSEYHTVKSEHKVGGKAVTMFSPDYSKKGK